jgi:hypothetical protein
VKGKTNQQKQNAELKTRKETYLMKTKILRNTLVTQTKNTAILPVLITLTLACFALSPPARALLPPPAPDGGYPNDNTAEGANALFNLTTGTGNTAIGTDALDSNTSGDFNTAIGELALASNTSSNNTATGDSALFGNTTGSNNTANGGFALFSNTTGSNNTATGGSALSSNTTASNNTASGESALSSNTTGSNNTANGFQALTFNTTGGSNTANGDSALFSNTTGSSNTATGGLALQDNTTGFQNTATGNNALLKNSTGHNNTANGVQAIRGPVLGFGTGSNNTASGFQALLNLATGSNNIALGAGAGLNLTTGNNNIDIGNPGVVAEANTIRMGIEGTQTNTYIAGIRGVMLANGIAVYVDTNGHLGTAPSSERFKEAIKPMDKASEAILGLKPVTFRYKSDNTKTPQFGLIAEEVAQVNPDLVVHDKGGEIYSVRYDQVNAMLLNEFLKEHRTVQKQQKEIDILKTELQEQKALIQKVSAQVELNKPAPQTVLNNH